MKICEECGCEVAEQTLESGLCPVCVEETVGAVEWMLGTLTEPQRRYVREHPHLIYR